MFLILQRFFCRAVASFCDKKDKKGVKSPPVIKVVKHPLFAGNFEALEMKWKNFPEQRQLLRYPIYLQPCLYRTEDIDYLHFKFSNLF